MSLQQNSVLSDEINSVRGKMLQPGGEVRWGGMSLSVTLSPMQVQCHERLFI